jgi:hypothetical protein
MKKAIYHNEDGRERNDLLVLKENSNGTVDIGTDDGTLIIGQCPIGTKSGQCTIQTASESKAEAAEEAKEAKAEAKAEAAEKKHK